MGGVDEMCTTSDESVDHLICNHFSRKVQNSGLKTLVREVWFEKSGSKNLVREIWFEKSG